MKKIFALLMALAVMFNSFAASFAEVPSPALRASQIMIPIGKNGQKVSLQAFTNLSVKQYQDVSGQHLKLVDKLAFKLTQKQFKKVINSDGTVNAKKLADLNKKIQKAAAADNKKNLKLALILLGVSVILLVLGAIAPIISVFGLIAFLASVVYFIIYFANM